MVASRRSSNQIHFLVKANGEIIRDHDQLKLHCNDFFRSSLGQDHASPTSCSHEWLQMLLHFRLSFAHGIELARNVTATDIKNSLFSLPRNKAPGPDGYPADFFVACWDIIGNDLISAVSEFFVSNCLLKQWNATIISLIPKTTNASTLTNFHPIACCNTLYKIISKILATRLKKILPHFISKNQSAFIKGRLLVENVLLASELTHNYDKNDGTPRAMLKVDLRKAFDSVRWEFIIQILDAIDIPSRVRNWISTCISTASFSVACNGELCGYFQGKRGIRQGDALSPYLFIMIMEVFSKLLQQKYDNGTIGFHPNASLPPISHLVFADDVVIFFDGKVESLNEIMSTLEEFSNWSGLQINHSKSHLFTSGLNFQERSSLDGFGFQAGGWPMTYLGLPLMCKRLRKNDFNPLIDKIISRFTHWTTKSLSFAGRLQLINSVIYGMVNFWFSAFILPKACIKNIECLCCKFLWAGNMDKRHYAKISWKTTCLPKNEGGLGLKSFALWNRILILRLVWLHFSGSESLWVAWNKENKIKNKSFWEVKARQHDSWMWRAILNHRHILQKIIKCHLGNGVNASFWYDNWSDLGPLIEFLGHSGRGQTGIALSAKVKDATTDFGWIIRQPRTHESLVLATILTTMTDVRTSTAKDTYFLEVNGKKHSQFVSSMLWDTLRPRDTLKNWASTIWFKFFSPKPAFTMWVANWDRLPTKMRLLNWGMQIDQDCTLCSLYDECRDHLLLRCPYSSSVWQLILQRLGAPFDHFLSWTAMIQWASYESTTTPRLLKRIIVHNTIDQLWRERNIRLHDRISRSSQVIFNIIDRIVRDTILANLKRKSFRNLMQIWLTRS